MTIPLKENILSAFLLSIPFILIWAYISCTITIPDVALGYTNDQIIPPGFYFKFPWTHVDLKTNRYHDIELLIPTRLSNGISIDYRFDMMDLRWNPIYFQEQWSHNETLYTQTQICNLKPYVDKYMRDNRIVGISNELTDDLRDYILPYLDLNGLEYDTRRGSSIAFRYICTFAGDGLNELQALESNNNPYTSSNIHDSMYNGYKKYNVHSSDASFAEHRAAYPLPTQTMIPDNELSPNTIASQDDLNKRLAKFNIKHNYPNN